MLHNDRTEYMRKLTPNSNAGVRIEGDKATRENIASESQDRDNKLISGKM